MATGHRTKYRAERGVLIVATFLMLTVSVAGQTESAGNRVVAQNPLPIIRSSRPTETSENREIELLKAQLAAQQDEIAALRKTVEEQGRLIASVIQTDANSKTLPVNSAKSDLNQSKLPSAGPLAKNETPMADPLRRSPQAIAAQEKPSPLSFRIGNSHLTPFGSFDLTAVIRDKNGASGISTNFGSIPFNNDVNGHLREYRFSAQKVRMGLRVDAKVRGMDLLGYLETDFQGFAPGNVAVTSNSDTQRLRLAWVDLRKGKLELLTGQSWSLLTPSRKGLSPLPTDIFLTQVVDSNYQVGLTWSRSPQFRLIYHATNTITLGWSVEASEQYAGGASGSGEITLPSELAASYGPQLNTGGSTFSVPNAHQDNIVKIAFDPNIGKRAVHFEVAGLLSRFAFFNPLSNQSFSASGGGVAVNGNVELVKNLRLFANTFYSNGGGRLIFAQGPDLIIRGDGSPGLVRSASTLDGIEFQATPKTLVYAYYGGSYFQRAVAIDPANGQQVGFGHINSPSNHNRALQQATLGFTHTFWRDPNYGAMQFMSQYSYLVRHPWFVAPGQPGSAHLNMLYLNLRYTWPGAPPARQ